MHPAAPGQRLFQNRPEHLEIDRLCVKLELVAEVAQLLKPLLDIEKTSLTLHFRAPVHRRRHRQ